MTPNLPDHPTDLTAERRAYLKALRNFVAAPPTTAGLYLKNLPRIIIVVVILGGAAVAGWAYETYWAMWSAAGVLAGLLLSDAANISRAVRLWPATAAVVDWERLDRLVGGYDSGRERT